MEIAIVALDDFTDKAVFMPWDILKLQGWNVQIYGTAEIHHK
ncbi:hypothetical protein [Bacillus sp. CRN 9]